MNKGTIELIGMLFILLFSVSGLVGMSYLILSNAPNALAQTQNITTNNITLQAGGAGNVTTASSANNNTEFYSRQPFGINMSVANFSNDTLQFAMLAWYNESSEINFFNLTNASSRNSSHASYYNGSALEFGTYFNSTGNKGMFRNLTVGVFNRTNGCGSALNASCWIWLNTTSTNEPFNFSINEKATNRVSVTVNNPTTAQNASNFTTARPFYVNITGNDTFSMATLYLNHSGPAKAPDQQNLTIGSGNANATNGSALVTFDDNYLGDFVNLTFSVRDAFGNFSWANTTATNHPRYFRVDIVNPTVGPIYVHVLNYTKGNPSFRSFYNVTVINVTLNITANNTAYAIPGISFPSNRTHTLFNVTNASFSLNETNGLGNFSINESHITVVVKPNQSITFNNNYNITYLAMYNVSDTPIQLDGNLLNVTWFVYDNNTMNSSVVVIDSNNNTYYTRGYSRGSSAVANTTFSANISGNFSNLAGSEIRLVDGLFRVAGRGEDWRAGTIGYTSNVSLVKTNLTSSSKQSIVAWYQNLTLNNITRFIPNVTSVSVFDNRWGWKNFTTCVVGVSTNCDLNVTGSLNVTLIRTSQNLVLLRHYTDEGIIRGKNHTVQTGGWNLIGVRSIINDLNQTMQNQSRNAYFNASAGIDFLDLTANITHVSFYNNSFQSGRHCTGFRNFSYTSCTPTFNLSNIVVPEGSGMWMLFSHNYSFNSTNLSVYRR